MTEVGRARRRLDEAAADLRDVLKRSTRALIQGGMEITGCTAPLRAELVREIEAEADGGAAEVS